MFEFAGLLVQVAQQGLHRGAFTVQIGVPVHSPVMKTVTVLLQLRTLLTQRSPYRSVKSHLSLKRM